MAAAHEIILAAGALGPLAILVGLLSAQIGTPLLLAFIGVGVLAGEDGPGGIPFDDLKAAYLIGSLALAAILFQGGLNTSRDMIRKALWPSLALATVGVAVSAGIVGVAAHGLFGFSWREVIVVVSVALQGWTISPAARLLRLTAEPPKPTVELFPIEGDRKKLYLTVL